MSPSAEMETLSTNSHNRAKAGRLLIGAVAGVFVAAMDEVDDNEDEGVTNEAVTRGRAAVLEASTPESGSRSGSGAAEEGTPHNSGDPPAY
jgi:hypothetical protein